MKGYICDGDGCDAKLPLEYGTAGESSNEYPQDWYVAKGPKDDTALIFCSVACLVKCMHRKECSAQEKQSQQPTDLARSQEG